MYISTFRASLPVFPHNICSHAHRVARGFDALGGDANLLRGIAQIDGNVLGTRRERVSEVWKDLAVVHDVLALELER